MKNNKLKFFKDNFSLKDFIGLIAFNKKPTKPNTWHNLILLEAGVFSLVACSSKFNGKKTYSEILRYLYNEENNLIEHWKDLEKEGYLLPSINSNFKLINPKKKYEFSVINEEIDLAAAYAFHIIFSKVNSTYYISFWYEDFEAQSGEYSFLNKSFKSLMNLGIVSSLKRIYSSDLSANFRLLAFVGRFFHSSEMNFHQSLAYVLSESEPSCFVKASSKSMNMKIMMLLYFFLHILFCYRKPMISSFYRTNNNFIFI